jgi:hypothetical protein
MGKASSSKKVARAAVTGGGRTRQGARPWGWYTAIALVAVLGVVAIVSSRSDRQAALNPLKSEKPRPPEASRKFPGDHWHAAYGVYACDRWLPQITSERDPQGIHTHDDGVIHIHPFTRAASGRRATLGVFTRTVGMTLTEDRVKMPDGESFTEGERCGGKRAELKVLLNGEERLGDPKQIRLRDRDAIVIAFVPEGTEVPPLPTVAQLDNLSDVPGGGASTPRSTEVTTPPGVPAPYGVSPPDGTETTPPPATGTDTPAGAP